jgi:hypothetical protein
MRIFGHYAQEIQSLRAKRGSLGARIRSHGWPRFARSDSFFSCCSRSVCGIGPDSGKLAMTGGFFMLRWIKNHLFMEGLFAFDHQGYPLAQKSYRLVRLNLQQ